MYKHFLRCISALLVLVMFINMVPVRALDDLVADDNAEIIAPESPVKSTEPAVIVAEIPDGRTEYSKEFLLSNGLHMAVLYADPVHYRKNGQWQEINNTLTTTQSGTYTNTEGIWEVSFPQQAGASQAVTVTKDGYTLSFGMPQKLSGNPNVSVMSAETIDRVQASGVTASVQANIDVSALKEQEQYPQTVLEKLSSRVTYENIHTGTDVVYELSSNRVKESVILSQYDSTLRGFAYVLNTGAMIPVLAEEGHITFYDESQTKVIMVMPAPFMQDAAMEMTTDVQVGLTGQDGKYLLTYLLPQSWLASAERQWPVVLDPVVQPSLQITNIRDASVAEGTTFSYTSPTLETGYYHGEGKQRTYLKYENLPPLTSADTVVAAQIVLRKMNNSSVSAPVEVHKVLGSWASESITWSNKPAYDTTVEDFVICAEARSYCWDVTDIAQQWYATGNNYGMLFKTSDAVENAGADNYKQFYSSDYSNNSETLPTLAIFFLNRNGLEKHWDFTTSSAGRAGTGYVNNYTGNLVWTRSDMGFGGNRMPAEIQHVYNTNDAALNTFGMGYGWRSNYNQRVYRWDTDGDGTIEAAETYYVWEDADGTKHYFELKDGSYQDEENMKLTLTTNGTGNSKYIITDKNGNTSHFDTQGRLTKLQNNQATPSSIQIAYQSGNLISTVTDGAGRVYGFTYSGGLLTRISFKGTGSTELSHTAYTYENGNLKTVEDNDGKKTQYGYGTNHLLTSAKDVDGYQITYTYHAVTGSFAPHRVASIREQDGTATGGHVTIAYHNNQTVFTDVVNNTKLTYQFNNWGNTVSVQDDEGKAQFMEYDRNIWDDDTGKGNQLNMSSKLQNTVVNLLPDGSFENGSLWTPVGNLTTRIVPYCNHGQNAMALSGGGTGFLRSSSFTAKPGKTYTISAQVAVGSGLTWIGIGDANGENAQWSTPISPNNEFEYAQVSYTNDTTANQTVYALFKGEATTAFLDCVQVEEMPTASRFNWVSNGDFLSPSGWTGTNLTSGDTVTAAPTAVAGLNTSAYKLTGSYSTVKTVKQTIAVMGVEGNSYVFGGWAMGNSASLTQLGDEPAKEFALRCTLYSNGTVVTEETVSFNPDVEHWQFVSDAVVATGNFDSLSIELVYGNNANTVYFDGLQVFREEFGTTFAYDEDGNVKSVTDLQNKLTNYEYDTNNNLTKIIQDNKVKMSYEYDGYHNVTSATTEEGLKYDFLYDTYGNNTKVSITSGGQTISSEAFYTANGDLLSYTKDALGKETHYGYNVNTGLLEWVQYPEDTTATRTEYTYDSMYRTATVAADTSSGLELSVSYGYTDDLLTSITTPSTAYSFTYGDFAQRTAVKVGTRTLANYTYESQTNRLTQLTYGNQDYVRYTYDSHGRVIGQTYEDGATVTFAYDNSGNLATVTDSATGTVTTYYYDLLNRQVGYWEKNDSVDHKVTYLYNEDNNIESMTETVNGVTKTYTYTYDEDNRVTSMTVDGITVTYTYDGFGRLTQKQTANGTQTVRTDSLTYRTVGNATTSQVSAYNGTTYTYDDNGNILTVTDSSGTVSYTYDTANQLLTETNEAKEYHNVWTYDDAGNILARMECEYIDGVVESIDDQYNYTYGDSQWGDLLTVYDTQTLTYDEVGNLTGDGQWTYTWKHGRQLTSMTRGNTTWTFTYDANGMRTGRSPGFEQSTYTYVYNGDKLSRMTVEGMTFDFTYDINGTPLTITLDESFVYYYETNLQGDVIGILDSSGARVVSYAYDAWGNVQITQNYQLAEFNPLLYRGYVYDFETGLYYVSSRYYDPEIGRWINADSVIAGVGGEILGYNMFAYCMNNPVNMSDPSGNWPKWLETAVKVASVVVAVTAVVVMVATVSAVSAGTAAPGALLGASVFLGAALSGINGGVANEAKGNSYINGYLGGATGGTIQAACSKTPAGTIVGGGFGVTVGTAVTDVMNNLDPDSANSTAKEIASNAITSGGKALVTSSLTAYMGYASDLAAINGANGLMPTYTRGFGEAVKAFFGWLDDALVYIWE